MKKTTATNPKNAIYKNKQWLEEQYKTRGLTSIAKDVGVSEKTLDYWFKKHGLVKRSRFESLKITTARKNKVNADFFRCINTEEKAYFLGLIMADGSIDARISKHGNTSYILELALHNEDRYILEKFKSVVSTGSEVVFKNNTNSSRISICCTNFCENLIRSGVSVNKTSFEIIPSSVPDNLKHHFVRGFFDGDGCITTNFRERTRAKLHFVSGEKMMNDLRDFFESKGLRYSEKSLHKHKIANAYELETTSLPNIAKAYDILYKDATVFLYRKKEKFDEFIRVYLQSPRVMRRYSPILRPKG